VTDHVIDAIDAALRDWGTSDDAMRVSYADSLPPVEEREVPPSSTGVDISGWREIGYTTDEPVGTYANADSFRRAAAEQVILYGQIYLERLRPGPGLRVVAVGAEEFSIGPLRMTPEREAWDSVREAFTATGRAAAQTMEGFGRAAAVVGERFTSYAAWMGEANQRDECPPTPPQPLSAREKALEARRNRHTGPARNPHRHRGI
jgi:hypothetical protein